jgi:hypothetical protein
MTVARHADATNVLRSYRILVDGHVVGKIGAGEVRHFNLAPGKHAISVRVDWCQSMPLNVTKSADRNLIIRCGATYNDWRCLFMSFLKPRKFIYLRADA